MLLSRLAGASLLWGLRFLQDLLTWTTSLLFSMHYNGLRRPLPPITDSALLHSATALARKIRNGQMKSEDVVRAYVARIRTVNPLLNAVVDERFAEALEEARAVDEAVRAMDQSQRMALEKEKPLYGVPITVKENFQIKGMRQTGGLVERRREVSVEDAEAVKRLRASGALVLAVTNISELCTWWESRNNVYGQTNNPYDLTRTAGGSSGGEGSVVGGAASVVGIGSDIGGSIRMPCYFSGIFGHKCSSGLTCNAGQLPKVEGDRQAFLSTGPLCRYATDLGLFVRVLSGEAGLQLKLDEPVDLKKIKVYYMVDDGGFPLTSSVSYDLREAQLKVVGYFERAYKLKAQKICFPEMARSIELWAAEIAAPSEFPSFCEELTQRKGALNVYSELVKWTLGCSNHTFPALAVGLLEKCETGKTQSERKEVADLKSKLMADVTKVLGDDGVLLYPSFPVVAPYHYQPLLTPCNFGYQAVFNILGLPVTQCPLGLSTKERLPLGVQVVAGPMKDRLTIAVAAELEKAFGGWVPPCDVLCQV